MTVGAPVGRLFPRVNWFLASQGLFHLSFPRYRGLREAQELLSEAWMVSFCSLVLEVPGRVKNPPRK